VNKTSPFKTIQVKNVSLDLSHAKLQLRFDASTISTDLKLCDTEYRFVAGPVR